MVAHKSRRRLRRIIGAVHGPDPDHPNYLALVWRRFRVSAIWPPRRNWDRRHSAADLGPVSDFRPWQGVNAACPVEHDYPAANLARPASGTPAARCRLIRK